MHARKTRQRKKEQMKTLEQQVEVLKAHQVTLKLRIEEKNTVNILVELYGTKCEGDAVTMDPTVEGLLKRLTDEIPDSSKIPELPALILPGQHSNRRKGQDGGTNVTQEYPDDGIDYKLLAKDRATCSQAELDRIRRERNRMHAKRTRDRKRIFVEEMDGIIKQLDGENRLLETYLESISDSPINTPTLGRSPTLGASTPTEMPAAIDMLGKACETDIAKLFVKRAAEDVSSDASTSSMSTHDDSGSDPSQDLPDEHSRKRRCFAPKVLQLC